MNFGMDNFLEIGEYVNALGHANVRLRTLNDDRVIFNGFESTMLYLRELLVPEIYLYRVIGCIFSDSELYAFEEQLLNCMRQLNGLFYVHPDTHLILQRNLTIRCKDRPVDYTDLTSGARETIAGFVAEQYGSYMRVKQRVEEYQNLRKK